MVSGSIKGDDFKVSTIDMLPGWLHTFHDVSIYYLTNRFHFAVCLYSDNAQMTSKRGENKEVRYEPQASSVTDVLTTF